MQLRTWQNCPFTFGLPTSKVPSAKGPRVRQASRCSLSLAQNESLPRVTLQFPLFGIHLYLSGPNRGIHFQFSGPKRGSPFICRSLKRNGELAGGLSFQGFPSPRRALCPCLLGFFGGECLVFVPLWLPVPRKPDHFNGQWCLGASSFFWRELPPPKKHEK